MVLYNKLDQKYWGLEDYTDENALSITGTIYSDAALNTVFDLTGYTLEFRFISQGKIIIANDDDIAIVTAASGTWRLKPQSGNITIDGDGQVVIRLEKSGTRVSAIGIEGSSDLLIERV